jgi:hypothetical protein
LCGTAHPGRRTRCAPSTGAAGCPVGRTTPAAASRRAARARRTVADARGTGARGGASRMASTPSAGRPGPAIASARRALNVLSIGQARSVSKLRVIFRANRRGLVLATKPGAGASALRTRHRVTSGRERVSSRNALNTASVLLSGLVESLTHTEERMSPKPRTVQKTSTAPRGKGEGAGWRDPTLPLVLEAPAPAEGSTTVSVRAPRADVQRWRLAMALEGLSTIQEWAFRTLNRAARQRAEK